MPEPTPDRPALLGGPPAVPQGPPDWPPADEGVRQALAEAFHDGSWGKYHGGRVRRLEERLACYHGVELALPCGSGTFAVELALRALQVGPGDEVILAAYDYPGNFLGVHAVGARPVLVDVDPNNWNLEPGRLNEAIGPRTRAVIASHLHGGVVAMGEVLEVARRQGVAVIEDAAQATGATVGGRKAGSWGDAGVLSFGGSKLLSAGRGGALLTSDPAVGQRARLWLHRGNHVCPLSELQAAVLLPQLDLLDQRHATRLQSVQLLTGLLRDVPGLRPFGNRAADSEPGYYKLGFQYRPELLGGLQRECFVRAVRAEGVALDEGFRALHAGRSPSRFRQVGGLEQSTMAHRGSVVLHHPVLLGGADDMRAVARAICKVATHAPQLRD